MWSSDDCFFFSPRIGGNLDVVYCWRRIISDNMTNRKGRKLVRFRRNLENSGNNLTLVEILVSILFNPFSQHDIVQPLFALISRKLF